MKQILTTVIIAIIIGVISIATADHVEQSNIVLRQTSYAKTQGQHDEQIRKNSKDIVILTSHSETIDWKLGHILDAQTELKDEFKRLKCSDY